jgi:transposase
MRFVPVKSIEQQDILALHRVRERLVKARTALANELRGLMTEYGVVLPKGIDLLARRCAEVLLKQTTLFTNMARQTFYELLDEIHALDERIDRYDKKLETLSRTHPVCQRLMTVPGVGPITASAVVAAVGDASAFKNGRQFSAWLGLVPRQHSSGGKERLLGISKRGDGYLRRLLVHGARSAVLHAGRYRDKRGAWLKQVLLRRGMNRATVALANKNARVMWVLMMRDTESFRRIPLPEAA